jgi:hypothetical protein
MTRWIAILPLFFFFSAAAQEDSSYTKMLAAAPEISINDSLEITTDGWHLKRLDSLDVKKWFAPLLGTTTNNRLKNRSYFLAGKITINPDYDILLMLEEKKKDTTGVEVIHLITTKKGGQYISSKEIAVSGMRKKTNYNTSSWMYPGMRFRKTSNYTINGEPKYETENYNINPHGRFILSINQ